MRSLACGFWQFLTCIKMSISKNFEQIILISRNHNYYKIGFMSIFRLVHCVPGHAKRQRYLRMYFNLNASKVIKLQLFNNFWKLVAAYKSRYKALIPNFHLVPLTSLYLSDKYLELSKTCDNVRKRIIMANFFVRVCYFFVRACWFFAMVCWFFAIACWFFAMIFETSGSDLQKKIEFKDVNDVKEHCARALSVDPEMNMDCCITGFCVKRTGLKLDKLLDDSPITNSWFHCDGKHIA